MPNTQLFLQFGMAGAVLVSLWMFLRFLRDERKSAETERSRFLDTLDKYRQTLDLVVSNCPKK